VWQTGNTSSFLKEKEKKLFVDDMGAFTIWTSQQCDA
jgi:hypothetical protein